MCSVLMDSIKMDLRIKNTHLTHYQIFQRRPPKQAPRQLPCGQKSKANSSRQNMSPMKGWVLRAAQYNPDYIHQLLGTIILVSYYILSIMNNKCNSMYPFYGPIGASSFSTCVAAGIPCRRLVQTKPQLHGFFWPSHFGQLRWSCGKDHSTLLQ